MEKVDPIADPVLSGVIIRLADEGVPLAAITRSTHVPREDVRLIVQEAIDNGTITEAPRDDWPPGKRRAQRLPAFGEGSDETAVALGCSRTFGTTPQQSAVLALILRRPEVTKEAIHGVIERGRPADRPETDPKMVDVVVHHIRKKLRTYGIELKTLWGYGFSIDRQGRETALAMIDAFQTNGVSVAQEAA